MVGREYGLYHTSLGATQQGCASRRDDDCGSHDEQTLIDIGSTTGGAIQA
ncbi:hypothetical protein JG688_00007551 [Phytophthora aleatoria]|uniref:Uncharacterized protein n=1 Tax=Phytophthora aleatoria TaxID=2496075 RepID=A0A8J5J7V3_9STRA|nr:hypothetical protein JG688_00007551 [Phytophthora aleatoria]